jgi:NAD(P)-dependent dehydrogenase (short-subunit alcohol dehydrogenase family)
MSRFHGRGVLVAGSTGMAAATVRALRAEGAAVFVVSRTEAHVRSLAEDVGAAGWRAANLVDEDAVEAVVTHAAAVLPRLDAAYAVAGISGRRSGDGPLDEMTLEGWETVLRANATSTFLVARAVIRRMRDQDPDEDGQRGTVLAMSSALARHPSPVHFGTHGYAASKGAIESLVRAAAATYARLGIRVNAIAPALVGTPMSERAQSDPAIRAYLERKQPLANGPIDADAVTPVALHLLSRDARAITGQVVEVDAGWSVSEG